VASSTQKEKEREMLQRVGILHKKMSDTPDELIYKTLVSQLARFAIASVEKESPLEKRVRCLEREIERLKTKREVEALPSKADVVYLMFKEELEKEHYGEIVAIDVESEKIVGLGSSILEAYRKAKEKTGKKRFSYRRIGFPFVHRI